MTPIFIPTFFHFFPLNGQNILEFTILSSKIKELFIQESQDADSAFSSKNLHRFIGKKVCGKNENLHPLTDEGECRGEGWVCRPRFLVRSLV